MAFACHRSLGGTRHAFQFLIRFPCTKAFQHTNGQLLLIRLELTQRLDLIHSGPRVSRAWLLYHSAICQDHHNRHNRIQDEVLQFSRTRCRRDYSHQRTTGRPPTRRVASGPGISWASKASWTSWATWAPCASVEKSLISDRSCQKEFGELFSSEIPASEELESKLM